MEIENLNLTDEQKDAVEKLIQSETDKVRTKYSAELKEKTAELEQYKPKEKTDEERSLEERIKAIEEREAKLQEKEKSIALENKLKDKGLPTELADYLKLGDNEDEAIDKIGNFLLSQGNVPGGHAQNSGMSVKDFRKLSYTERAKLWNDNPTLYQQLANK